MVDAAFEMSEGFVSSLLGESEELVLASTSVFVATALLNPLELDEESESVGSEEAVNKQDIIGNYLPHTAQWRNSRGRGNVSPDTSDREISADLPEKEREGKKGKWRIKEGKSKRKRWKIENGRRKSEKMRRGFFFSLLFLFTFQND